MLVYLNNIFNIISLLGNLLMHFYIICNDFVALVYSSISLSCSVQHANFPMKCIKTTVALPNNVYKINSFITYSVSTTKCTIVLKKKKKIKRFILY